MTLKSVHDEYSLFVIKVGKVIKSLISVDYFSMAFFAQLHGNLDEDIPFLVCLFIGGGGYSIWKCYEIRFPRLLILVPHTPIYIPLYYDLLWSCDPDFHYRRQSHNSVLSGHSCLAGLLLYPRSTKLKGAILVSPCPSVRLWTKSCPLCNFYNTRPFISTNQATSAGASRFFFVCLFVCFLFFCLFVFWFYFSKLNNLQFWQII